MHVKGFTLIELSIVLVIIGLIVGGVLVGQDLIRAAGVRSTISQIEKYQTAVNTFRGKYGYLPGDIPPSATQQFGFTVDAGRSGIAAEGDGNGVISGSGTYGGSGPQPWGQSGETLFFWEDLSINSGLIDGAFSAVSNPSGTPISNPHGTYYGNTTDMQKYFPAAKIGRGNYIYVYEYNGNVYTDATGGQCYPGRSINYFGLSAPVYIQYGYGGFANSGTPEDFPGLTVSEAYSIDKKVDDGLPISGNVIAQYLQGTGDGNPYCTTFSPSANAPSSATCFDKTSWTYSVNQSNGAGVNCGLSFRFQ